MPQAASSIMVFQQEFSVTNIKYSSELFHCNGTIFCEFIIIIILKKIILPRLHCQVQIKMVYIRQCMGDLIFLD